MKKYFPSYQGYFLFLFSTFFMILFLFLPSFHVVFLSRTFGTNWQRKSVVFSTYADFTSPAIKFEFSSFFEQKSEALHEKKISGLLLL